MKISQDYTPEDTSTATVQASSHGLESFFENKLGLTAHWGLYSLGHSSNEWAYYHERTSEQQNQYLGRLQHFNPTRFDANEWADLMLEAGLKFLVMTSKHHDGFCLWDSAHTDFKVSNTPFTRDILGELAEALQARGLGLHFYYSLVDWTHPAYRNDWAEYVAYYQSQVRELCTRFGEIGGFVFDGYWPRNQMETPDEIEYFSARGSWALAQTYDLIHSLQPHAVITNNTHILPLKGEDYQVWELDLPGSNSAGFNTSQIGTKPLAAWQNVNAGWSYQPWNHQVKSPVELLDFYRQAQQLQAVCFMNVGPRAFGDIHPQEQQVLRELGRLIRDLEP